MRRRSVLAVAITAGPLLAACSSSGSQSAQTAPEPSVTPTTTANPLTFNAANFPSTPRVDNAWFPLLPGSVWKYTGSKDNEASRDVVTITARTKVVDGVPAVVVQDNLYFGDALEERTSDWYAQDNAGNVWYLGEDTAELDEHGKVTSTEGSWESGKQGAVPGIFMPASPVVGQSGRQEYFKGQAEDHYRVLSLSAPIKGVPGTDATTGLLTEEWTPLEPGVLDHKLYAQGVGTVKEETVRGGKETNTLVSFKPGA
jgi:hypothetical protein